MINRILRLKLVVVPFSFTLFVLVLAMGSYANNCISAGPAHLMMRICCGGNQREALVCGGDVANSCDPLGGELISCGPSCFITNASSEFCGNSSSEVQPTHKGILLAAQAPCGTADSSRQEKSGSGEFAAWLSKHAKRGK